ncbi:MAG: DNA-processing protein DprA [Patescibacteria group bacterium]
MSYQPPNDAVKNPHEWTASRLGWLALASFEGFGSRTLRKLARRFGADGSAALAVKPDMLEEMGHGTRVIEKFLEFRRATDPLTLAEKLEHENISFVLFENQDYPQILRESSDPPFALFLRGATIPSKQTFVALVGTRDMTPYGKNIAMTLGRELAQAGIGIVSGLALGIDAAAHEGVLDAGGYALAVLGSGVDDATLYPRHNLGLSRRILENGGTIISEFPPGTEGRKFNFPLRNRIIASLAKATVIVEAAEASGSLITAHLALDENRDVFAVPGPITSPQSAGTNRLLAMGAIPCLATADILLSLGNAPAPVQQALPAFDLTEDERTLLKHLTYPRQIDELARELALPVSTVSMAITNLELYGCITQESGKIAARAHAARTATD